MEATKPRCDWCGSDPLYITYHDVEWGTPSRNDVHLYEMLVLEGMQSGLSWITILRKRTAFREAFSQFDPNRVAAFTENDIEALLKNPGIIRHRGKLSAAVENARAVLKIQEQHGSLSKYLWRFVGDRPVVNLRRKEDRPPVDSPVAHDLARALKGFGCRFVGPTTCYAFMQAVGMVNDHLLTCFRHPRFSSALPESR